MDREQYPHQRKTVHIPDGYTKVVVFPNNSISWDGLFTSWSDDEWKSFGLNKIRYKKQDKSEIVDIVIDHQKRIVFVLYPTHWGRNSSNSRIFTIKRKRRNAADHGS